MSETPQPLSANQVLTEQEVEALRFAEELYGARAKEATDTVGMALGLDETARGQLVGGISLKLEGLDFEQRHQIARNLDEVSSILGGTVLNENSRPPVKLDVAPSSRDQTPATETSAPAQPLNRIQESWLINLYGPEGTSRVAALNPESRIEFVRSLTDTYENLKIPRLGSAAKQQRGEQLMALLVESRSYREIAEDFDMQEPALRARLNNMIGSIKSRVPANELLDIIPPPQAVTASIPRTVPPPSPEADIRPELTSIQQRWYGKVFDDIEDVKRIEALDVDQRAYLAVRLGNYLNSAVIRSQGQVKTARRIREVSLLTEGKDYEAIAETIDCNVATVKSDLHHSATRLKETVPPDYLSNLIKEAENIDQHSDAIA